jgi:hypothetical protein
MVMRVGAMSPTTPAPERTDIMGGVVAVLSPVPTLIPAEVAITFMPVNFWTSETSMPTY